MSQPTSREGSGIACSRPPWCTCRSTAGAGVPCSPARPIWGSNRVWRAGCSRVRAMTCWSTSSAGRTGRCWRVGLLDDLRVRERIARLVRTRLDVLGPHREAMRRATAARLMPSNGLTACGSLWRTVDLMWSAAGDDARDTSYYTKRSLLAAVWTSIVLCTGWRTARRTTPRLGPFSRGASPTSCRSASCALASTTSSSSSAGSTPWRNGGDRGASAPGCWRPARASAASALVRRRGPCAFDPRTGGQRRP